MFRRNKLFFWTAEILLLTLIFYLWREMGAIITPFVTVVNTIMIPLPIQSLPFWKRDVRLIV